MKRLLCAASLCLALAACDLPQTADATQRQQTEQSLQQATSQLGMPAIVNFQEKRMMKQIYEMRDNAIATHSYIVNEMRGCFVYLGPSIGFGLPYAAQYSNPQRPARAFETFEQGNITLPQAEPNGLFMPADAEGTWILLKDPQGTDAKPVYIEERVIVSPFRLTAQECKAQS